jgi:hypothetical protein
VNMEKVAKWAGATLRTTVNIETGAVAVLVDGLGKIIPFASTRDAAIYLAGVKRGAQRFAFAQENEGDTWPPGWQGDQ